MFSELHEKYADYCLQFLTSEQQEIIKPNIELFKRAMISPDFDYADIHLPEEIVKLLPNKLQMLATSTSLGKWEHMLPIDFPGEASEFIEEYIKKLTDINFRYADEAIVDWFNLALKYCKDGDIPTALYHLGRACHLVQDICIPMHCLMCLNLVDAVDIITGNEPNHNTFELHCNTNFEQIKQLIIVSDKKFELPITIHEIAEHSRELFFYCDGINFLSVKNIKFRNFLRKIFWFLLENYDKAATEVNQNAINYTVSFVKLFFEKALAK
jgi:hypothetical protein